MSNQLPYIPRDENGIAHIVALSGGKDSTAMALLLAERNPTVPYTYVCTPTGDELPEMIEHWANLETLLGCPIIRLMHPGGLVQLQVEQNALPNYRMRFCTRILKLVPFAQFVRSVMPAVSYVGLRADEEHREGVSQRGGDAKARVPDMETKHPLQDWGMDEDAVWKYLNDKGVSIPARTDCARCFYQKLGEWYLLWRDYPDLYADAEKDEERYGHTYRSPGRDTWPAPLSELRKRFESGDKPETSLRMMENRTGMCRACTI